MPRQLEVWLSGAHIGTLAQIDGRLGFSYAAGWLAHPGAVPLSQSLPLQVGTFDDRAARPFFAGLLPDGDQRKRVAQVLHVSRQNDFALLGGIGGECAGAVTLLEPGQAPQAADAPNAVRWLDDGELLRLIDEMPQRPMLAGDADMRLSLAGAQDKLPVVAEGGRIGLPRFGTPSTHILKPAIVGTAGIEGSVFNEGFCMALAHALGLDVAPTSIAQVGDRPYLLVARYDRQDSPTGQSLYRSAGQPLGTLCTGGWPVARPDQKAHPRHGPTPARPGPGTVDCVAGPGQKPPHPRAHRGAGGAALQPHHAPPDPARRRARHAYQSILI